VADGALPVALFVHTRPELLDRTLECLRLTGAELLYVFSDGPRDPAERVKVDAVRERVRAIGWTEPVVIERETNLGLSDSIRRGLEDLFKRHDRVVIIEDDICVAPGFMPFVARCLAHYEDDSRVAGVTGLRLPFDRACFAHYAFDAFATPRFHSWGWATWRRGWETFDFDADRLERRLRAARVRAADAGADLAALVDAAVLRRQLEGAWDVFCAASMLVNRQAFIAPVWNLVENTGFASGTHFSSPPPWTLAWEQPPDRFAGEPRLPPPVVDERILRAWKAFAAGPRPSLLWRVSRRVRQRRS
jgi:hypothetical protein